MFCPKCGKENTENRQLCQFCSWVLSDTSSCVPTDVNAKNSPLAIWSLVLGILTPFVFFVTAIPAVVCGIIGLIKINKSQGQLKGNGLAIAGITIPAILGVFIVPMMLAILLPALANVRCLASKQMCGTNLAGIGKAMMVYANDYDQFPNPNWCNLLIDYADVSEEQFKCPDSEEGPCNYAMNENIIGLGVTAPSDMVLLFETTGGWNQVGGPELLTTENHQGEGLNVLYVDGHVKFEKDANSLRWTTE